MAGVGFVRLPGGFFVARSEKESTAKMPKTDYFTIPEVQQALDCSRKRVQRLMAAGQLPRFVSNADSRRVLIPVDAVERLKEPVPFPSRRPQATDRIEAA